MWWANKMFGFYKIIKSKHAWYNILVYVFGFVLSVSKK